LLLVALMIWLIPKLWRFIRGIIRRISGASGTSLSTRRDDSAGQSPDV
jgi:hypothetical protein